MSWACTPTAPDKGCCLQWLQVHPLVAKSPGALDTICEKAHQQSLCGAAARLEGTVKSGSVTVVSSNIEAPTQLHRPRQICRWGLQARQAHSCSTHLIRQPSRLISSV